MSVLEGPIDFSRMTKEEMSSYLFDVALRNYIRILIDYDKPITQWTDDMRQKVATEHGFETMRGRYHNMAAEAYIKKFGLPNEDSTLIKARTEITRIVQETFASWSRQD